MTDIFSRGGGRGGQRDVFSGKVTVVGREGGGGIEVFTLARFQGRYIERG